ncbi:MAG: YciI family protein [Chloroflexota bacterium]
MSTYVLELKFDRDNARRMEVRPAHRDHLKELLDQGKLIMAGPWGDDSGAMIILNVQDETEARSIIAKDPYTHADCVTVASLRPWTPILPAP